MTTYSFLDNFLSIAGPGGSFQIGGPGAGNAEEGFTIEAAGDKNTMTPSAGGGAMHSLHADKTGKLAVRLLKTSPVNQKLMNMYNLQTTSSALHGQNVITHRDVARGDTSSGKEVAFKKAPATTAAKEAGLMEWEFDIGILDRQFGSGTPAL